MADRAEVEPGFFEAAGIEILRRRNFNDADWPETQPVVIVSESMAPRFWTDGDTVGRLVRRRNDDPPWLVVGAGERRERADARRGAAQHDLRPYPQRFTPSPDRLGEDVDRPGADGSRSWPPGASWIPISGSSRQRRWTATSR